MVKQASLGPFIRNLLYNPEAKKYLKYPMYTSYEMWQQYNVYRKSTGGKGITNQNWLRIMYVLKELELIIKIDKPKQSITPVPGENHPSGYIPNTYLFTWEHIINYLGKLTDDEIHSLFDYLSTKHNIDWIYTSKTEVSEEKDKISFIKDEEYIELIPNIEFDIINIFLNDTKIDSFEIRKENNMHTAFFIDTRMDWKRTYYRAVTKNIDIESWYNPQLAYRIQINSVSLQQDLATQEIDKQWKRLIKTYTNKNIEAEINITTPIPEEYSSELKEIIEFYRLTGFKPYQSIKKMRDIIKHKQDYIKKLVIPPREDYVTIKVKKALKDRIDAERGEMTISEYIEMKLQ